MTRPKPVVFLFSEDRTSNQLSALRITPHSAPCSDDSPTWQRSCNRPWQVKKTKTLGYGMIQPPACDPGSATRSKQNTAHLCTEIMAKRWKFCLCSPFVQQKIIEVIRLEVHFQVNPPYLGVQKKQTKNPAAVQWTYGNLQKDRHFFLFTLIHQYVFKNGGLIFSTSFWGRQKHQPFFAAVTWCPWFSRQRSAPRGCSLWTTPRPWRWPSLRWPHDGRGVPREWPKAA